MRSLPHIRFLYASVLAFFVLATYGIVSGLDWILLLPVVLLIIFMALFRLEQLVFLTVFLTPLSINLSETPLGFGISLPGEPLIFGLMLLTFLRIFMEGGLDKKILYHPISILILIHLAWFVLTTITSSMVVVSIKYSMARIWFVTVFFYLLSLMFRNFKNIVRFIWCYTIPLLLVIIYSTYRHSLDGFSEEAAHISMTPFYNDHTAYAAALAMVFPVLLSLVFIPEIKGWKRILFFLISLVVLVAIVLSYTRAAWVGLSASLLTFFAFLFKINYKIVITLAAVFLVAVMVNWTRLIIKLEGNRKQSSTEYASHLQSISNISTDASNVERINRWASAIRMFLERPVFGWGPGTYQFKYAPFQQFNEKTIISTNAGNRGNAHSEYIGPLAEQGPVGTLAFISILIAVILTASRIIRKHESIHARILCIGLLLGLITYWVHGFLNFFLDTDKASVPFWGFIAAITALDVYHVKKQSISASTSGIGSVT